MCHRESRKYIQLSHKNSRNNDLICKQNSVNLDATIPVKQFSSTSIQRKQKTNGKNSKRKYVCVSKEIMKFHQKKGDE